VSKQSPSYDQFSYPICWKTTCGVQSVKIAEFYYRNRSFRSRYPVFEAVNNRGSFFFESWVLTHPLLKCLFLCFTTDSCESYRWIYELTMKSICFPIYSQGKSEQFNLKAGYWVPFQLNLHSMKRTWKRPAIILKRPLIYISWTRNSVEFKIMGVFILFHVYFFRVTVVWIWSSTKAPVCTTQHNSVNKIVLLCCVWVLEKLWVSKVRIVLLCIVQLLCFIVQWWCANQWFC